MGWRQIVCKLSLFVRCNCARVRLWFTLSSFRFLRRDFLRLLLNYIGMRGSWRSQGLGALVVPLHLARAHRWVVHVLLVAAEAGEPLLLAGQGFLGRLEFPRQEVVRELVDLSELAPLPLQQEVPVLDRLLQVLLAVRGVLPAYSLPGSRSEGNRRRRKGASVNQSVSQRANERGGLGRSQRRAGTHRGSAFSASALGLVVGFPESVSISFRVTCAEEAARGARAGQSEGLERDEAKAGRTHPDCRHHCGTRNPKASARAGGLARSVFLRFLSDLGSLQHFLGNICPSTFPRKYLIHSRIASFEQIWEMNQKLELVVDKAGTEAFSHFCASLSRPCSSRWCSDS